MSKSHCTPRRCKNFLIPTLIDVSHLPVAQPFAPFAQQASLAANKYLDSFLLVEQLIQGSRIRRIQVYDLFQGIFTDTTHF